MFGGGLMGGCHSCGTKDHTSHGLGHNMAGCGKMDAVVVVVFWWRVHSTRHPRTPYASQDILCWAD